MTNEKLLNICLKKLKIMEEDLESVAAKDLHELLRAWELMHRHRAAECVTQHTLFRKETRWPGYYYRGDVMKVDDENWHVLTVYVAVVIGLCQGRTTKPPHRYRLQR